MNVRGFHHLAIQVRDLPRATAFYREVLGLPLMAEHHRPDGTLRSVWLSLGGPSPEGFVALEACDGEVVVTPFRDPSPGPHLLALRISREDRAEALRALTAKGIEIVHQTRWSFYFRDPEGNRVALSHHPEDPVDA